MPFWSKGREGKGITNGLWTLPVLSLLDIQKAYHQVGGGSDDGNRFRWTCEDSEVHNFIILSDRNGLED